MKNIKNTIFALAAAAALMMTGSCVTTGINSSTGTGSLFTDVTESVSAGAASTGSRQGKACASNILGIIAVGDASVQAAANSGGIKKIASVDRSYFRILSLYGESCTMVTGE